VVIRALITGAAGFAGSYLVEECLAAGYEVHGTSVSRTASTEVPAGLTLHQCDLGQPEAIAELVADLDPNRVFHLAGQAAVGAAWGDPTATFVSNLFLTQHVLEAVRRGAPEARVLAVASGEVYGDVDPARTPVVEDEPFRPVNPYGVSKAAADLLALQYFLAFDLAVVRVRPFNHIGPRQQRGFVLADFAAQVAAIERGEAPPVVSTGNLEGTRDFTDVRDVARAYRLALELGTPGAVYNVCSGVATSIGDLLAILINACQVQVRTETDPSLYRPVDQPAVLGCNTALRAATAWQPAIPLAQTVIDTLAYWRNAH
jgi:GDP-4-dehydro-6-deoxy-D-mannose reductase